MFNASRRQVSKYLKAAENSTENRLSYVADRFVELQEMREAADYERNAEISPFRARLAVELAENAFQTWELVRNEQAAHDYLFSRIFKERSAKPPDRA